MNRERALNRIEQGWKAFLESFTDLTDNMLMESGAVGHWSVRDVLTHITSWEEEALKALPIILDGNPTPRYRRYGGIDAFNALEQERKRQLSIDEVKQELMATHKHLLTFLAELPESAFSANRRFLKRLRLDTYNHYREHAVQITRWRAER